MVYFILRIAQFLAVIGALCGIAFYILSIWSARSFLRDVASPLPVFTPPLSVLKPLHGIDRGMYESFRGHCVQDYPAYELIFAVSEPNDPAIRLVEQLQREFPLRAIRLIVSSTLLGTNTKVSNLAQMLPHATYEHILVNDSDIRVRPDYLRRVMAPLQHPGVGLVTTLYRGIAGKTLASKLEAIGISTDFSAGVLTARLIEGGVHFALGSTLALRKKVLQSIGGFETLVDYLADDFELGLRVSAAGLKVLISDVVVDHLLPDYTLQGYWQHQLRWNRSTRDSRPWGYLGLVLTFGFPWALLALALSRGANWAWALVGTAVVSRLLMAWIVSIRVLHDRQFWGQLWLLPIRDLLAVGIWIASYAGHTIAWRGNRLRLDKGKLRPA